MCLLSVTWTLSATMVTLGSLGQAPCHLYGEVTQIPCSDVVGALCPPHLSINGVELHPRPLPSSPPVRLGATE